MQALARMRARPVYKWSQRVSAHLLLCTVAGNGSVHYAGGYHFSFSTDLDERWTASQVCATWPGICRHWPGCVPGLSTKGRREFLPIFYYALSLEMVLCIMQVGTISALAPFQLLAHRF